MSRRMLFVASVVSLTASLALLVPPAQGQPERPSRVVIIVLDQARPDTIERYGMENVQQLQRNGASFPNALVGHMAAETVISHNVITSGQLPKHMGWSNEVYRDSANVLGTPGAYHVTSSMSCAQFAALIDAGGYGKLQDYLDVRFGETSAFASISQKRTSACTSGHTSSAVGDGTATPDPEDLIFQIRGGNVAAQCGSGWRRREYVGVLRSYFGFTNDCTDRWWTFQGAGAYGTGALSPANLYPLDGNRFVPGFDPAHIGGDNWSADAAIRFIENEPDWHGMLVSLGAIDKLGHMWGPEDEGEPGAAPGSVEEMRHLPFIAKNADEQVGKIVAALNSSGLLDETLIVITAEHAAQTGRRFYGRLAPGVLNPSASRPRPGSGRTATGTSAATPTRSIAIPVRRSRRSGHARRQPGLLVPGRPYRGLAARHVACKEARGGRGGSRDARRDRELLHERRSGRLRAVRDQPHRGGRAQLVRQARRGARRHDGRTLGC